MHGLSDIPQQRLENSFQRIDTLLGTFHHEHIVILSYTLSSAVLLYLIGYTVYKAIRQKKILQKLQTKEIFWREKYNGDPPIYIRKKISFFTLLNFCGPFIFFSFLMILLFYSINKQHSYDTSFTQSTLTGKLAPKTYLPLLNHDGYLTIEQFKGHITLINFWGSWCLPCRQEHPILMEIAKDKRFHLIGINYKDNKDNAKRFLANFGNPFKYIGFDTTGHAAIDWGVYGPPETFLLNKDGTIIAKHTGTLTEQIYQKKILPEIEKAVATTQSPTK